MRLSLYYGLPFLRRDFCLRRILAVRIWRNLLFLIGCVIGSREEHLCLVHVLMVFRCVLDAVSLFVCEAASVVSDVDPNGHVVRLSFYGWGFLSVLWYLRLTMVCWDPSDFWGGSVVLCWRCFWIHQTFVSEMDAGSVVVRTFSCWSDFNMRASVKHELLGHGFHDELFN